MSTKTKVKKKQSDHYKKVQKVPAPELVVTGATSKDLKDVKYRVTFLMDHNFLGERRTKGTSIEVESWVYEAYKGRVNMLNFTLIQ